jgi:hypothetical protein
MQIAVQGDANQGALPVDLALSIEAQKPKAEADAGTASAVSVSVKITSAKLGITGVPQELAARFGKLKGAKVEYDVSPDGAGSGYHYELPAGAEDARDQLRVLSDVLALVTLPLPAEPVGNGAYWMATSRDGVFGLDLVTYRLVKVEEVSGNAVTLSLGTKRYATSNRFDFEGLPPDAPHELAEFESKSDGKLRLVSGSPFPATGDLQSVLAATLAMPNQQRGVLQIQSRATFDFGKTKAPAQ